MSKTYNIAVVGATGVVGEAMLEILSERDFPVGQIYALASERSIGKTVSFGHRELKVEDLATFDFSNAHIGLFSAGGSISAEYAPKAAAAGCVVTIFKIRKVAAALLLTTVAASTPASVASAPVTSKICCAV